MEKIFIGGIAYDPDSFNPEARAQLEMLLFTEQRIRQLRADIAIAETARTAYTNRLFTLLPDGEELRIEEGFAG
ncbi:MAG: hypothetical protein EBS54_02450 [Betaproteobacteria bacterium]|nr:hypothetical protein [Betaproteobacteria bacterium]NBT05649.1 hypothetical protein [Betaproteobacteria bacterium]NDE53707.1 hypothetical protein [Actinomycetota bacterium]